MKTLKWRVILSAALLLVTSVAVAGGPIKIDAGKEPNSSLGAVQGINSGSDGELQVAALRSIVGAYQTLHGVESLPINTTFTVTWSDGSETVGDYVNTSSAGVTIVSTSGGSGGGGGGGGGGDGGGSSGGDPVSGPFGGDCDLNPCTNQGGDGDD